MEKKLLNENDFADKYVGSIIPIHILLKNPVLKISNECLETPFL